jgi:ubiquitin-like domain-containing CTD phosphatase 1
MPSDSLVIPDDSTVDSPDVISTDNVGSDYHASRNSSPIKAPQVSTDDIPEHWTVLRFTWSGKAFELSVADTDRLVSSPRLLRTIARQNYTLTVQRKSLRPQDCLTRPDECSFRTTEDTRSGERKVTGGPGPYVGRSYPLTVRARDDTCLPISSDLRLPAGKKFTLVGTPEGDEIKDPSGLSTFNTTRLIIHGADS